MSDSGTDVFERIRNGNGVFVTAAGAANSGSGVISSGAVVTPASLTGHNYQINFAVAAGATTYSVVDSTTATTLSAGNPYTSGNSIGFDGLQFDIQGSPANGDQFTVAPSTNQSLFKTLNDLIAVVATPVNGQTGNTRLTNGLNTALSNLDRGLDNILSVRAASRHAIAGSGRVAKHRQRPCTPVSADAIAIAGRGLCDGDLRP